MKKTTKIPRIIKINEVQQFKIFCVFNNGENRIIDFEELMKSWQLKADDFRHHLKKPEVFKEVEISNFTLGWTRLKQKIKLSSGQEFEVPLELDPVVLYENSLPDTDRNQRYFIGSLLKKARKRAGLTQEELAQRSGTTKNYISRIENDKSDIELRTLRKIIEIGLGQNLEIRIA